LKIRPEVLPCVLAAVLTGPVAAGAVYLSGGGAAAMEAAGLAIPVILTGYFLYFFRDPERTPPSDPDIAVAGADGIVMRIKEMQEERFLKTDTVRISIFLSLFDVHVNRAPIGGESRFLGYFRGRHLFTFQEKSSDVNQHNAILIENERTKCLVLQIVGPVARRVVYWHDPDRPVSIVKGDRIGMMKFGSRMDIYFPKGEVEVLAREGQRVRAGETPIAKIIGRKAL